MADSVIQAVTGKFVEYSVDELKKQLNYLCFYSSNVQTLAEALEELNNRHQSVQQKVDVARANSEVITPEVDAWFRKVEELKIRSDEILRHNEEIQRSSVRKWLPLLHYSLARKARKAARDCVALRNTPFDTISNPGIPAELPPVPNPSYSVFESHKVIEDRIMHALKDPNVSSIGIWGIGGVGKTEMTKNIERKVRDEKTLFEHIVVVVVSQQPDLPKLQSQIAKALNLILDDESPDLRQKKLYQKLMAEKSILIILDDLWERLDLEAFGIPSQSKHCKLILTSRNEDALTSTSVAEENIFPLETLTKEESWRFFKHNAGINDDDSHSELVQIAKKVERECKRLPLALKIVASAVKGKDISFWNNTVRELHKSVPYNIPGVSKGVYGTLLYSINALEGKEQKDLFLLCCLFPEDYSISTEELLRCGIGLRIFKGFENLTEVREKVESLLKILLSRSLLIEGNRFSDNLLEGNMFSDNLHVRMHDVMRDVGIWITTEEGMVGSNNEKPQFKISHRLNEWPLMMEEDYTCISLRSSHNSIIFPESIVCPKLEFLRLHHLDYDAKLPTNFFNGMSELKVLEALRIRLLPPSIGELNSLRTLFLHYCEIFQTVSVLGKLSNLEILSLENCEFEMLPVEIGGLKNLKQMHISNCERLRKVAFGVLSEFARLEELVILDSFDSWDSEDGGENDVACLSELNDLKNLINLKIEIKNPSVVPVEKPLWFQKVKKYNIRMTKCKFQDYGKKYFQKAILLGKEVEFPLGHWIYDKASDAEYLNLEGSNCMNVWNRLSQNCGNLSCLKQLRLAKFTNIRYLDEGLPKGAIFRELKSLHIQESLSLQQIFICKEQLYLKNLQSINISQCDNLSYLFSLCVVQSLVQLSKLSVTSCKTMKEIFKKDDGESVKINKIELPKLRFLYFEDLESFCHFCNGIDRIELAQLVELSLCYLPSMKMTKDDNNEYLIPKVAWMNFNFCGLTNLKVDGIGNFKCMFSPSVISGVPNLIWLEVRDCSMLEQVIGKGDENVGKDDETILLKNLKRLILRYLPNILTFCYKAIQLPSLEELTILDCPKMLKFVEESNSTPFINKQVYCPKLNKLFLYKLNNISAVFSPLTFTSLTNLKSLYVRDCEELEHIIIKEEEGETAYDQKVPFDYLYLIKLPKLYGSIFQMEHPLEFPRLDRIRIEDCPMLEKFSLGSVHLPELEITPILEIHSEKNCFIISIKEISFSSDLPEDIKLRFLPIGSSQSFANVIFLSKRRKIVGKFKIEKIQTGTEYEIMLMIMWDEDIMWREDRMWVEDESELIELVKIELKIPGESKLQQRTETLKNQAKRIWTEISIGKFIMREPQQINEELEFSLRNAADTHLWVKGVRIVEV